MVDAKLVIYMFADAIKQEAKTYGPVFERLAAKGMVGFVADKIKEAPPEVNTLDEAVKYVSTNLDRYPRGYTTLIYGAGKALKSIEGTTGAGLKMLSKSLMKTIFSKVRLDQVIGQITGTTEALSKCVQFVEMGNVVEKGMLSCSEEGTKTMLKITGCDYEDMCRKIKEEGLTRAAGGIDCGWGVTGSTAVEIVTRVPHDFMMVRFSPPNCEASIFRLD